MFLIILIESPLAPLRRRRLWDVKFNKQIKALSSIYLAAKVAQLSCAASQACPAWWKRSPTTNFALKAQLLGNAPGSGSDCAFFPFRIPRRTWAAYAGLQRADWARGIRWLYIAASAVLPSLLIVTALLCRGGRIPLQWWIQASNHCSNALVWCSLSLSRRSSETHSMHVPRFHTCWIWYGA